MIALSALLVWMAPAFAGSSAFPAAAIKIFIRYSSIFEVEDKRLKTQRHCEPRFLGRGNLSKKRDCFG